MRSILLFVTMLIALSGCATTGTANLPPVMELHELNQPYSKVGRINVTRTVYGVDYAVSPNLHEWGLDALRREAYKIDADAVIFPEISSKELNFLIFSAFPTTEYRATGVAIRFAR